MRMYVKLHVFKQIVPNDPLTLFISPNVRREMEEAEKNKHRMGFTDAELAFRVRNHVFCGLRNNDWMR